MNIKDKLIEIKKKIIEAVKNGNLIKVEAQITTRDIDDDTKEKLLSTPHFTENTEIPAAKAMSDFIQSKYSSSNDLSDKIDDFIEWYTDNMIREKHMDIGIYYEPIEMRNFIEKMAVWYELRYPDYEINNLLPGSGKEPKRTPIGWFDIKSFINLLSFDEKYYLKKPKYPDIVYYDYSHMRGHMHLSSKGIVKISKDMDSVITGISNKDLEGMHIKEVVKMIEDKGILIPEDSEFIKAINNYENSIYQREEMLNCVMYRIIDRGGNRIGPRRAFLFAKEFRRNIDIPMMYGIDRSDPGLRLFINEYIKAGGSKNLMCYEDYFFKSSKEDQLNTITIQELLLKYIHNAPTSYTSEEDKLHQQPVNASERQGVKRLVLEKDEMNKP